MEETVSPEQAQEELEALSSAYRSIDDELKRAERERDTVRSRMSFLVYTLGGKAITSVYSLILSKPATIARYDTKELDTLVTALLKEGHTAIAERIARTRSESERPGGLVVRRVEAMKKGHGEE